MLEGVRYTDELLASLYEGVENSFETYSDPFATELYKKKTAGNLVVSELWKAMNIRSLEVNNPTKGERENAAE